VRKRRRIEYRYNPVDLERDVAVGIKLSFNNQVYPKPAEHAGNLEELADTERSHRSVFMQSYTTEEQAHSNLYTLILTVKGERRMQPEFGCDLPYYLFEQLDDGLMGRIRAEVIDDIRYWLPYIIVESLDVTYAKEPASESEAHAITMRLRYRVTHQGAEKEITVFVTQSGTKIAQGEKI